MIIKKIILILVALLASGAIIFLALKENTLSVSRGSGDSAEIDAWKDSLFVVSSGAKNSLLGIQRSASSTTEFVTNEIVANYVSMQKSKGEVPLSDTELEQIVESVSEKVQKMDTMKLYNESDLVVVLSEESSIATYQKNFTEALTAFAKKNTTNELLFVAQALDDRDASKLAPIAENITNYEALVSKLVAMGTPRSYVNFHLSVLQGYANILAGLYDMQNIITDPARGMRGIVKYQSGAQLLEKLLGTLNAQ